MGEQHSSPGLKSHPPSPEK
ncbi:hypothetical protein J1605_011499 [Eschrichtius robustus]|uniref:Uncharacterized protein n=1 Tax=Eschrichtius robustus TaxID=9764 RepID=A0AB34GJB2_ESCRO|nr:hypothetical protein J1605_013692 [Eschrichtius robustus]KAJ8780542.1 hypothetical protein J1605_011499 [Eschrichtius robustus]